MKNSMNNFLIPESQRVDPEVTTTLYIDEVPSEVAYDLLMESLSKGKMATQEEIIERINNKETIRMSYEELAQHIIKMSQEKERALVEQIFEQEEEIYEVVREHHSGIWKINPDNPNEEIITCLECGNIMARRNINSQSIVLPSDKNKELLRMLDEEAREDKDEDIEEDMERDGATPYYEMENNSGPGDDYDSEPEIPRFRL